MSRLLLRLRMMAKRLKFPMTSSHRSEAPLRLHLGCGSEYWPGWINVDVEREAVCDVHMDFLRIRERYPDESIAEIAMIHSLGYLRLWEARALLGDLYQLLIQDGGRLIIELPDLSKCARRLLDCEEKENDYLEAVRGIYAFGMEQVERCESYTPYAFGWSGWHLKAELRRAGFKEVTLHEPVTHGPRPWRDIRIEAVKTRSPQ